MMLLRKEETLCIGGSGRANPLLRETTRLRDLVLASLMGSLTAVVMLFQVPLFLPFLKLDLADGILLFLATFMSPPLLLLTILIKLTLFFILKGDEYTWLGAIMSGIASLSLILPSHYFWKSFGLNLKKALIGGSLGIISSVLVMTLLNYYILTFLFHSTQVRNLLLLGVIPFNLIKGLISLGIMISICRLSGILSKGNEDNRI